MRARASLAALLLALTACTNGPTGYPVHQQRPLAMVPVGEAGVQDERAAFRAHFCQLTASAGQALPDHQPCEEALVRLAGEQGSGPGIDSQAITRQRYRIVVVLGVGWDCLQGFVAVDKLPHQHLAALGYDVTLLHVDALSSSARNASEIIQQLAEQDQDNRPVILVGYSKGAVDILEAVARDQPGTRNVVAILSVAGSIGGSPLADTASQHTLDLMRFAPGAACDVGDDGALASLRTGMRQDWLAQHPVVDTTPLRAKLYEYMLATAVEEEITVSIADVINILLLSDNNPFPYYLTLLQRQDFINHLVDEERAWDVKAIIPLLQEDLLILGGEFDVNVPPQELHWIHDTIASPNKRILILPNAGHDHYISQPGPFAAAVLDFVR